MEPLNLLSKKEAAEYLGIKINTLQKWTQRKHIACYRYPNPLSGRPKYKKEDLDRFINQGRIEARPKFGDLKQFYRRAG